MEKGNALNIWAMAFVSTRFFFFFFFKWNREKISMEYKDNELDASLKIYGFWKKGPGN
jgi:hypothetical protein